VVDAADCTDENDSKADFFFHSVEKELGHPVGMYG